MIQEPQLSHLYQEVILDHNKHPRNFKELAQPTQYSHGVNPLCGDDYHLYLKINPAGVIEDIGFQGSGCAISKSSASIMTSMIKGMRVQEAAELKNNFLQLMTQDAGVESLLKKVGRMNIFSGVKEFPVRVKCATLIWHALDDTLKDLQPRPASGG